MMTLPASAKLKIFSLAALASDMAALTDGTTRRIAHLSEALGFAENTELDIANLEVELSRMRATLSHQQSKSNQRAQLVTQLNVWAEGLVGNVTVSEVGWPVPELMKAESHRTAVQRLRMKINELEGELRNLKHAVMLRTEQKARATRWVAELAASVSPTVTASLSEGLRVNFENAASWASKPMPLAFMAWVNPDAVAQRLHEIIDAAPHRLELTRREQEKRTAEVTSALLTVERQEEAHILAAADEQLEIERRPHADPQAVLGVAVVRRAAIIRR